MRRDQRPRHAGGLNLVLFSDLSIASERATFRSRAAARRSLTRGSPRASPRCRPRQGQVPAVHRCRPRRPPGRRAFLVGKVVLHAELERELAWTLEMIRRTGPQSRAAVKDFNCCLLAPDGNMFRRAIMSPEMAEGFQALFEKRPPNWPPLRLIAARAL
ncbi:MAG: hypothetical protein U0802_22835 [Candidatus Binatia bacterium]